MKADLQQRVLLFLRPGCLYRTSDVARELGIREGQARYALCRLSRGGSSLPRNARATGGAYTQPSNCS